MLDPISAKEVIWYSDSRGEVRGRKFWIMPDGQIKLKSLTTGNYVLSGWDTEFRNRYFRAIRQSLRAHRLDVPSTWYVTRLQSGKYVATVLPNGKTKTFNNVVEYLTWSDWVSKYEVIDCWSFSRFLELQRA